MKRISSIMLICTSVFKFGSNAFVPVLPSQCTIKTPTTLSMSKIDSERARYEKNLEDMMDNDWRFFRAQLVAQENAENEEAKVQAQQQQKAQEKQALKRRTYNTFEAIPKENMGSIFPHFLAQQQKKQRQPNLMLNPSPNPNPFSMIIPNSCEDPFISFAEIPVLMEPKATLDKRKWAHPIQHIEPGCVLIANEGLGGVFQKAVVLIIDHDEVKGTRGIIINKPMDGDLLTVSSDSDINISSTLKMAFSKASVTYGGPVASEDFSTLLHGYAHVEGSKKVAPGVFIGGSEELVNEVRRNNMDPREPLWVKGYAEWVSDQLYKEIDRGVWYLASCSSDLILRYTNGGVDEIEEEEGDDLWEDVLTCMGGQYAERTKEYVGDEGGERRALP